MKNKYQRINEYFNLIKDILVQNPNIDINNSLYSLLVSQNTKSKTTLSKLGIYDNWKRRFKNANINTSDNDSYIEFSKSSNLSQKNYIFLHTPIDHEHIENSINILIDFLERRKINYIVTISNTEKSDNVIIKLENDNNIDEICNFILSNKQINEGLIDINPFIFNYRRIGITIGNQLSYNQTLIEYIKNYISNRKKEDKLNLLGVQDFFNFLKDYYNKVFINRSELENHCAHFNIPETKNSTNLIVNYMSLTEQMLKNGDPKFNFEQLLEHYNDYNNQYSYNQKLVKFRHLKLSNENIKQTNNILKILFDYLTLTYSEEETICILETVILEQKYELITRKQGLRELLLEYNFAPNMLYLFQSNEMNLAEYLNKLHLTKKDDTQIREEINYVLIDLFNYYCENKDITERENMRSFIKRIQYYIETRDQRLITRNKQIRNKVIRTFFVEKFRYLLEKYNINIEDYINDLINSNKLGLDEYLENAIYETYDKYIHKKEEYLNNENKNENDELQYTHSGRDAVIYALNEFFSFGHYSVFTRENNARKNLEKNVSIMDAVNIMRKKLQHKVSDQLPTIEELNYLIPNYVDLVLENYEIKKILK